MVEKRSGPVRDAQGTVKFRHEAISCVLRAHPDDGLLTLLRLRTREPFAGQWSLPSGPLAAEESLSESALRHLYGRTGMSSAPHHVEQLQTYSSPARDPWDRTLATVYLCVVPWDEGQVSADYAETAQWVPVTELESLAFDHEEIVRAAVERLRAKMSYTNIAYALVPETFTISQLRSVYRAVLGYDVAPTNLTRVLMRRGQLEDTGQKSHPGVSGGRPAALYRFTSQQLHVTDPFATFKPTTS